MKLLLGIAVAGLGLSLSACGSNGSTTQAGTTPPPAPASAAVIVNVAQNPADGPVLTDGNGRTLYLFEKDHGTTSACTGACAQVWPALTGRAAPGAGVEGSKLQTANGQVPDQVTYNDHLLYSYSGDHASGDIKGVGIPGWYPVSPAGNKIDKDDNGTGSGTSTGY